MCRLDDLHQLREEIYRIAQKHNASKVYVFGSCARKEDTQESDVDILADFNENASLFDQIALQLDLAELFHCKVDVLPMSCLNDPVFGMTVKRDMIAL